MLLAIMPDQNNNTWQHPIRPTLKGWCAREGIALQCVKVGKMGALAWLYEVATF